LIINHLHRKTHENTCKKPAKLISSHSYLATATEMKNKPNMNRCDYKLLADRYKNAQPLMVPFDAEEESRKQNYITSKPNP
jgi:hypothetical protein